MAKRETSLKQVDFTVNYGENIQLCIFSPIKFNLTVRYIYFLFIESQHSYAVELFCSAHYDEAPASAVKAVHLSVSAC